MYECRCGKLKAEWIDPQKKKFCNICNSELAKILPKQLKISSFLSLDEDIVSGRRKQVLDCIKTLKRPNNREIAEHLHLPINSVTPRVNELRNMTRPLVCEDSTKVDSITLKRTMCWRAI